MDQVGTRSYHGILNFKVTRQGRTFGSSWNELPNPSSIINKNKFVAVACAEAECHVQNHVTLNFKVSRESDALYCIVLYLCIYIALLAVHTNQKRFQCERPREKKD